MISANLTSYVGSGLYVTAPCSPEAYTALRLSCYPKKKENLPHTLENGNALFNARSFGGLISGWFECHHCFSSWHLATSAYVIMERFCKLKRSLNRAQLGAVRCELAGWLSCAFRLCVLCWNWAFPRFPDSFPWKKAIKVLCCLLAWQESFPLGKAFIGKFMCASPSLVCRNQVCGSDWW